MATLRQMCLCFESFDSFYHAIFFYLGDSKSVKSMRRFILLRDILQSSPDKWCYSRRFGKLKVAALRGSSYFLTADIADLAHCATNFLVPVSRPLGIRGRLHVWIPDCCLQTTYANPEADHHHAVFKLPVSHAMAGIGTYGACYHPISCHGRQRDAWCVGVS